MHYDQEKYRLLFHNVKYFQGGVLDFLTFIGISTQIVVSAISAINAINNNNNNNNDNNNNNNNDNNDNNYNKNTFTIKVTNTRCQVNKLQYEKYICPFLNILKCDLSFYSTIVHFLQNS
jgi:hypothetical protein